MHIRQRAHIFPRSIATFHWGQRPRELCLRGKKWESCPWAVWNTFKYHPYGSIWAPKMKGFNMKPGILGGIWYYCIRKGLGSIPQPGMIPNVACLRLETTRHKWSQWTVRFAGRHVASTIPMPDLISHSKQRLCNGCHSFLRADWLVLAKPWQYSLCVNQGI